MASSVEKLLSNLAEHADWCDANEWEIPITMGDDIREAIVVIKHYRAIENTTMITIRSPENETWEFSGADWKNTEDFGIIWRCKRCGFRRLAGWTPPDYNCPECTGRDAKGEDQQSTKGDSDIWQRKEK